MLGSSSFAPFVLSEGFRVKDALGSAERQSVRGFWKVTLEGVSVTITIKFIATPPWLLTTAGWCFIALGIAGLVLPFLQGIRPQATRSPAIEVFSPGYDDEGDEPKTRGIIGLHKRAKREPQRKQCPLFSTTQHDRVSQMGIVGEENK